MPPRRLNESDEELTVVSSVVCEVRLPTYRRPRLLERALQSVCAQTHTRWRCIVFDDCPDGSARPVVDGVADARVSYRRNAGKLGAIGNIDQCFRNDPYDHGKYACVLEDDNYLLPRHLERQLQACERHGVDISFSAQLCENVLFSGEPGILGSSKTISWIYREGEHEPADMLPAILFSHAFSNGSVFWRIGSSTDFEIGELTVNPGVQETARILCLKDRVYVSHQATAVWRINDPQDSFVNKKLGDSAFSRARGRWRQLLEQREVMGLRRWYIKKYGVSRAFRFSSDNSVDFKARIERTLLMCGRYAVLTDRSFYWRIALMIRGFAFRVLVPSRLALSASRINAVFNDPGSIESV